MFSFVCYPKKSRDSDSIVSSPCICTIVQFHGYRIIEIDWAIKNNQEFMPTPKPPRKAKKQKKTKAACTEDVEMDVDGEAKLPSSRLHEATFGLELTNTGTDSPNKAKRQLDINEDRNDAGTSPKKQRRIGKVIATEKSDDEDWVCLAPHEPIVGS